MGLVNVGVLPALRLSYHHLPAHLKRCFAYCAIFPKDYKFQKQEMIPLWMAEGFLGQLEGKKHMEEVGDECFHDLLSRSFFQQYSNDATCFIMQDLINDLGKFVSGEFCSRLEGSIFCSVAVKIRHLLLERKGDALKKSGAISKNPGLRSFVVSKESEPSYCPCSAWWPNTCINERVTTDILQTLKRQRMLSLSWFNILELPNSNGNSKHLRYLNLSGNSLRMLPDGISALNNLQTLILFGCKNLVKLPSEFWKLINLRHLDVRDTQLQEMPSDMGKLKMLRKLTDFLLGKQSGSSIKELGELQHLQGELCIKNLQTVMDAQDVLAAIFKGKKILTALELRWEGYAYNAFHEREVVERLQAHESLARLCKSSRTQFPNWMGD